MILFGLCSWVIKDIVETTNETYAFPNGAVKVNASNVVTVLHDNMGMEEAQANRESTPRQCILDLTITFNLEEYTEWLKSPRGIQGYELLGAETQPTWKVQGKLGGYSE